MAHANHHSAYSRLTGRLNRFPQGAPPAELLLTVLKMIGKGLSEEAKPMVLMFNLIPE